MQIRPFHENDADAVARLIRKNLLTVNIRDYPARIMQSMARSYTAEMIAKLALQRETIVAIAEKRIVGTVSLEGNQVQNLFVEPDLQGSGIGKRLMSKIEEHARRQGLTALRLNASLTAIHFYEGIGYKRGEMIPSDEYGETCAMIKSL